MNGRPKIVPQEAGQQEFIENLLTGSQSKTAYALRINAEQMIKDNGIETIGFLTLTVGDPGKERFKQIHDSEEASRRINNLNRRFLPDLFERAIVVTERHKSGAIHFHVLGVVKGHPDIRTGVDFKAIAAGDYRTAPLKLRAIWETLRDKLPGYGFGRAELLPVRKTGEAVSRYVAKYIEKNVCNRLAEDKHKKLVRYVGWEKGQLKANDFGWGTKRAIAWRCKVRAIAGLINIYSPEQAAEAFGPRWAWLLTRLWRHTMGDDLACGFSWTWPERECVRAQLATMAPVFARREEQKTRILTAEEWADCKNEFMYATRN